MHLTFVEAASSHSSSTSSPSSIIPDYSISLSLGQKLELLGWKDVAMLSGREQELLVGLAEVLMSCSTDETIAKYLINWLPKQDIVSFQMLFPAGKANGIQQRAEAKVLGCGLYLDTPPAAAIF
eukprot:1137319-Pelagomonas_calceolata.AAC.1